MIGELAGKIRRQTKGVFGSHPQLSQVEADALIHPADNICRPPIQDTHALGLAIRILIRKVELAFCPATIWLPVLILRQARLPAGSTIRIIR
jgi:hypothetical protein